jgi:hypothetical protein
MKRGVGAKKQTNERVGLQDLKVLLMKLRTNSRTETLGRSVAARKHLTLCAFWLCASTSYGVPFVWKPRCPCRMNDRCLPACLFFPSAARKARHQSQTRAPHLFPSHCFSLIDAVGRPLPVLEKHRPYFLIFFLLAPDTDVTRGGVPW